MTRLQYRWWGLVGGSLLSWTLIVGCGGESTTNVTQPEDPAPTENPAEPAVSQNPQPAPASSGGNLLREQDGRKWIGDVPVDVWFDEPLAVASTVGQAPQAMQNQPTEVAKVDNPAPEEAPAPMETPASAPSSGGIDWQRIIPADLLDAEVTAIRNRFNADLQTVGSYNSSYLAIPPHVAALAVLSHVAAKHPGDIRWKENAKYIKQLAMEMNAEPLRRGPSSQKPLKEKFDYILEILNGSVPATLQAPPDDVATAEPAKVANIMKRLENASKLISVNGGTADAMKENAALLKQEAAVLGAMTQILLDGYEDYQDDEVFAGYVKDMVDASTAMREHVQNDQFDQFELDVSKMVKSCQDCHSTYR